MIMSKMARVSPWVEESRSGCDLARARGISGVVDSSGGFRGPSFLVSPSSFRRVSRVFVVSVLLRLVGNLVSSEEYDAESAFP